MAMKGIRYAQCWEDPKTLIDALHVDGEDDIVSIGSAGDNSFALLLNRPRSLTIVDSNPAQLFLIELKMHGLRTLDYDDFISFVGARPCQHRNRLFMFLRPSLSEEARRYWDMHPEVIGQGLIHCGKLEKYFAHFRRIILPLAHSQAEVRELLELPSLKQQRIFYDQIWNNRKWRWLFHVFFGKLLLGHFGRDPSNFYHVTKQSISDELLRRVRRGIVETRITNNYFIEYILTGQFRDLDGAHPYLRESNFQLLKESVGSIRLVEGSLQQFFHTLAPSSISKFNLSDIFEYMSLGSFESALREILRVCRDGARLAYWTLFVPRVVPPLLTDAFDSNDAMSKELFGQDRTFFYGNFHPWRCRSVPILPDVRFKRSHSVAQDSGLN